MESCDKAINVAVLFSKSLLEVRNFDSSIKKLILNTKSIKKLKLYFMIMIQLIIVFLFLK
ncbi:hypothetical protein CYV26_11700 [Carnobacterium maltaromaticum]|nr:hypothetical protein CYV33_11685 [Carnobacterium maltaromaticum]PLS35752.1 hypothetical protein CYV30_08510 [Carnobacterium maltaromaticum]PLS36201.1 hypothetical protein CYV31_08515 [Carnobacterium maltaromaticum]PLS42658.1 hypothetical protein CYV27_11685 [Carnobacterium maltaromaticum]PLS42893.1 hypothetical protein CYV28_08525 [Carnobacterium maltaromaticum]